MSSVDFDVDSLRSYLSSKLGGAVTGFEVLHDGLNLSIAFSIADDGSTYVLRRPNELRDSESFIDVTNEYDVLHRLRDTPIPAPEPVLVCENQSVIGDSFLVMTYLDGVTVPLGEYLPERFRNPANRWRIAATLVDTLAALHSVDVRPFADVCERRSPLDQVAESTERLEEASRETGHEPPAIWDVADWLRGNAPPDPGTVLCHGDFRPANVLFGGTDRAELSGVLDWETAFIGNPLTELGYLLLRWRDDGDPTLPLGDIRAKYANGSRIRKVVEWNEYGLAPFTNQPGSPSRKELVTRYEATTGKSFENERFHLGLAAFMLVAVWEDIYRHQLEEGASSDWEPRIDYMSSLANSVIRGNYPL